MKDIYNDKQRYEDWKAEAVEYGINGITKTNAKFVLDYLGDMEVGRNIARGSKKGARSYSRLNVLRNRIVQILGMFEHKGIKNISKLTEKQAHDLFDGMRKGTIKRLDGKVYKSSADYVKDFKSFWSWLVKVNKKKNIMLDDITGELDSSKDANAFCYFTKEQMDQMMPYFNEEEQTMLLFIYDTIIRTGKELSNVKVSDLDGVIQ